MSDDIKYWLAIVAISASVGLFSGRMSSAVIFFIAGGAIYLYWSKIARGGAVTIGDAQAAAAAAAKNLRRDLLPGR